MTWGSAVFIYHRKRFCNNQVTNEVVRQPVEVLQVLQSGLDELIDSSDSGTQSRAKSGFNTRNEIMQSNESSSRSMHNNDQNANCSEFNNDPFKESMAGIYQHLEEMKQTIATQLSEIRNTIEKDRVQYNEKQIKVEKNFKEVKDTITTQHGETSRRLKKLEGNTKLA